MLNSITHSSSLQLPSDIIGSIVNVFPAFIIPIALLSLVHIYMKLYLSAEKKEIDKYLRSEERSEWYEIDDECHDHNTIEPR
jgi:hypothetical protein